MTEKECDNCKYKDLKWREEPCRSCGIGRLYDKWEPIE